MLAIESFFILDIFSHYDIILIYLHEYGGVRYNVETRADKGTKIW